MRRPATTVHIEELVFHGFRPENAHPMTVAIERELARLITEYGGPSNGDSARHLEGGLLDARSSATATSTGGLVARAIHRALRP
jgi:hypothetical protein